MSIRLNPFRDITSDPRAEFRRQMGVEPEACGDARHEGTVPRSGSQLSYKEYNEVFEGDSWSFHNDKASILDVNLRPLTFVASGDSDTAIYEKADEGVLGTNLGAKRSHAHFTLGKGDDVARFTGNSQRNIAVLETESGTKKVELKLGGGDDKAVLYLNGGATGLIYVDGGSGEDTLQIRAKDKSLQYELVSDPEKLDLSIDPAKLRIVAENVERIEQYVAGQHVSTFGTFELGSSR